MSRACSLPGTRGSPMAPEEDGGHVVLQMCERVVGERFAGGEIMIGGVGQVLPGDGEAVAGRGFVEYGDGCVNDLGSDPVSGDDGDLVLDHSNPVARPHARQ